VNLAFRAAACSLALVSTACGGATLSPGSGSPQPSFRTLTRAELEHIAEQVAVARKLRARRVVIDHLSPEAFAARVAANVVSDDTARSEGLSEEQAFLLGFNFVPRPEERSGISGVDEVLEEEIAGFYDVERDRIVVPATPLRDEDEEFRQRAVVAHEVHHALQAHHFDVPDLSALPNDDARLAGLALIEGDAMVAMGAYLGLEHGAPVRRTLRQITDVTKDVSIEDVAHDKSNSALDRALRLTQRRLSFPYDDGMVFVSDIYRAGGFDLVDSLYARPPASTEHILHPERYIAGDLPRNVAVPKPAAGFRVVREGVLGELQITTLLEGCLSAVVARQAGAGWGGDRYAIAVNDEGRIATSWSSVWDTEDDAREFTEALQRAGGCFHENRLGEDEDDFEITADFSVKRVGDRVAFVRGLNVVDARPQLASLIALPAEEATLSPIEGVVIPPRRPLPEPRLGRVDVDVYESDWLGLVGRVPSGMNWATGDDGAELWIKRPDVLVLGGLFLSDRVTTVAQNEKAFAEVHSAFAHFARLAGLNVAFLGGGTIRTELGRAEERTWQVVGTSVQMRLMLIPICAGTGSLIFLQAWEDGYARSVLDGWMASFRFTDGRNLAVCDRLDPK